ncbi:glycosyltransferase family A protein [Flavobacterium frigoris]|uniref:glycosyltransferase family A protein n=1 Tax=Flavobacterium frigoris TaxID=229204 RepID=UPI0039E8966F
MTTIAPLVSIIIPNYNHENYLKHRLESVFNQSYTNFEIILLDDCSTDNSRAILLEYAQNPKVSHCVFNQINSGNTFVQWNKGISLAKGKYIWIAESDDFAVNTFLEDLLNVFYLNDELVLVYSQSNKVDENSSKTGSWIDFTSEFGKDFFLSNFVVDGNYFIERFLIYKNIIPNASGVLFLRDRAIQLGDLDTDKEMRYCGDWLFYIKLITNHSLGFVAEPLNNFRYHSNSVIARSKQINDRVYLINVVKIMRDKMISFFTIECPKNIIEISKINKKIIREHEYEKAMYLIRNNQKRLGFKVLLTVLDLFFIKNKFMKNFLLRWERFINTILKR